MINYVELLENLKIYNAVMLRILAAIVLSIFVASAILLLIRIVTSVIKTLVTELFKKLKNANIWIFKNIKYPVLKISWYLKGGYMDGNEGNK